LRGLISHGYSRTYVRSRGQGPLHLPDQSRYSQPSGQPKSLDARSASCRPPRWMSSAHRVAT
jgi:hypothetical protein